MLTTQYRWDDGASTIQRIDVRKFASGRLEAYIHAPGDAQAGSLLAVPEILKQSGFQVVSDHVGGSNVLRVTGFKEESKLFTALNEKSFVQGVPTKQQVGEEPKVPISQKLRNNSVKMSGLMGVIGHAAMAVSGVLEKKPALIATSSFYGASTLLPAIKGTGDSSGEFFQMVDDMRSHLEKEGVEIPQGTNLTAENLAKEGGVIPKLTKMLDDYPLQISNIIGSIGNVVLMTASVTSARKHNEPVDAGRLCGGLVSLVAGLSIALIPEKAKEKVKPTVQAWPGTENGEGAPVAPEAAGADDKDTSAPKRFVNWVREKPMQFAGGLFFVSNAAFAYQAVQKQKKYHADAEMVQEFKDANASDGMIDSMQTQLDKDKMALRFAYATAGTYFLSTAFTSISSKTKISDYNEQEILSKICAYSANMIASIPQDIRDEAIGKMAEHLAEQPKVLETKEEIVNIINEKVDQISQSPWVGKLAMEEIQSRHADAQSRINV